MKPRTPGLSRHFLPPSNRFHGNRDSSCRPVTINAILRGNFAVGFLQLVNGNDCGEFKSMQCQLSFEPTAFGKAPQWPPAIETPSCGGLEMTPDNLTPNNANTRR